MPLNVKIDLGYRPDLSGEALLEVVRAGLGDRYEVYDPGSFQVPDVMVKRSESEGVAIQILQHRLRKHTKLRVYGLSPSIAQRGFTPYGLVAQANETRPLLEDVLEFLRSSPELQPSAA